MTPPEALGLVLLVAGLLGFAWLTVDYVRDSRRPAHDHEEGVASDTCPRCNPPA